MNDQPETGKNLARRDLLPTPTLPSARPPPPHKTPTPTPAPQPPPTARAPQAEGPPAADIGYSPAILAEGKRLLTISGQGPKDKSADMETQIRQTLDKIGSLLKAGGAS